MPSSSLPIQAQVTQILSARRCRRGLSLRKAGVIPYQRLYRIEKNQVPMTLDEFVLLARYLGASPASVLKQALEDEP